MSRVTGAIVEIPEAFPGYVEWEGVKFPYSFFRPIHTKAPYNVPEFGFHADLPCENGAVLDFTYDSGLDKDTGRLENVESEQAVTIWAYVIHPETRVRIAASVLFNELRYSYSCGGVDGGCEDCEHDNGSWFAWVKTPQEVQEHWAFIGTLRVVPHAGSKRR